jgi:hypothetical protein
VTITTTNNKTQMFTYIQTANHFIWNSQYKEATELLTPYSKTNPRVAVELSSISSIMSQMNGSSELRAKTLEELRIAQDAVDSLKNNKKKIVCIIIISLLNIVLRIFY